MKSTKRRSKDPVSTTKPPPSSTLRDQVISYQNGLNLRRQALSQKDQLALLVLSLFLLIVVGGYGGYSLHQAAKDSQNNYQDQIADYFWLRAQAGNIDNNAVAASTTAGETAPPASRVSLQLSGSGITDAQVVAAGASVQLSFSHASQAVISAALSKLSQQGWQFTQLAMEQDALTKIIRVQATIAS